MESEFMSKRDQITELNQQLIGSRSELNEVKHDLNLLLERLVTSTVKYTEDHDACVDGAVEFLKGVIGDLRSISWIESFFKTDYTLTVSFTATGSGEFQNIGMYDIGEFLENYIDSDCEIEVNSFDLDEA